MHICIMAQKLHAGEMNQARTAGTMSCDPVAVANWPGGRHDNDCEDFRAIQVVPTASDVAAGVRGPFLPVAGGRRQRPVPALAEQVRLQHGAALACVGGWPSTPRTRCWPTTPTLMFTNHALDQILEAILVSGPPTDKRVLRVLHLLPVLGAILNCCISSYGNHPQKI